LLFLGITGPHGKHALAEGASAYMLKSAHPKDLAENDPSGSQPVMQRLFALEPL